MTDYFRVLDTGVLEGRLNIAIGQAIVEAHQLGEVPDTLRFLRFPPTVLIGRHQALAQEVNLDYCRENGIGTARRITGGGAIFMDSGLLGWELAFHRQTLGVKSLTELTREVCEAAADGISRIGVRACFRPRNDIEVDGRKISGTGGFFDGDTLFFQGTVLVDMNPRKMTSALRIPEAKLARHKLDSAAQRVVTLRELLGDDTPELPAIQGSLIDAFSERFGLPMKPGRLTDAEQANADKLLGEEIGTDEFVAEIEEPPAARGDLAGVCPSPGGSIKTYLRLEGPAQNRVRAALITGDFFVTPPRLIYDLESSLRGIRLEDIATVVKAFFQRSEFEVLSVAPEDFISSIEDALENE